MKRAWQVGSISFMLMSILVVVHSFKYSYGDDLGPGPGFFPFWLGLITGLLSLGLLLQTCLSKDLFSDAAALIPDRASIVRISIIVIGLLGVLALLNTLGFRISMMMFLIVLPLALGVKNKLIVLILAIAGSFGVFHIFYYWLKLPLPIGIFGI